MKRYILSVGIAAVSGVLLFIVAVFRLRGGLIVGAEVFIPMIYIPLVGYGVWKVLEGVEI